MLERKCWNLPSDTVLILLLFGMFLCQGRTDYSQVLLLNTVSVSILYSFFTAVCNKKPIVLNCDQLSSEYMLHSLHYVHNSGQLGIC